MAPSAASIEELNERYNAVMNSVLKRPDLKDTIQIDRDKAWEVVRAETGVPTEVGFDISAPVGQSLDYIP